MAFISEPVMIGFKSGLALFIGATQLPKLFGFKGGHGDFWERAGHFFQHLHETNTAALLTGLAALAVLVLGKDLSQEQTGGSVRGRRVDRAFLAARTWNAWE